MRGPDLQADILVLAFSEVARDPRVMRQLRALAPRYEVVAAGLGSAPTDVALRSYVQLEAPARRGLPRIAHRARGAAQLALRRWRAFHARSGCVAAALEALSGCRARLVIANDIDTLPVALARSGGSPILFDAHEWFPAEHAERLAWRLLFGPYRRAQCATLLPQVAAMTTVSPGLADAYRGAFGVEAEVILNAPPPAPLAPTPVAPDGVIRLVHHGGAQPGRRIEDMIEAVERARAPLSLDLLLVEVPGHERYLRKLTARAARGRVRVLPPVPQRELLARLNRYDVGIHLLPPSNENHMLALPNKLFDFVQARLGVAVGPAPEMARLVREHGLGLVADDASPAAFSRALERLSRARVEDFKRAAERASTALSWAAGEQRLLALVARLLPAGAG